MKKHLLAILLIIQAPLVFSQAPVVTNVSFAQRTDGSLKVDITYDLAYTGSETLELTVTASNDNGATWVLPCTSLTGDIGRGVSTGTSKTIVWDFYTDNPNQSGDQYKVRITAEEVTGTMTGNDGTVYKTVKIGNQWWMAENLKETQYRNGDTIPEESAEITWDYLELYTGARCAYNNSETIANTYGYLYNWYAVDDARNISPAGWHVPTDDEWKELEMTLGMSQTEANRTAAWRGTNEGSKLAGNSNLWNDGGLKNNAAFGESGFSAIPASSMIAAGNGLGNGAYFWASTEYDVNDFAWARYLLKDYSEIRRNGVFKTMALSVRLIKD